MGLIGFISDLHFPNDKMVLVGRLLKDFSLDGLVLNGDLVDFANDHSLSKLLRFLDKHGPSRIAVVLGNHEHYLSRNMIRRGLDSLAAREHIIERLRESGILVLDDMDKPVVMGNLFVAGCVGWYDYSLAPPGYDVRDFNNCNPFGISRKMLELCDLYRRHEYCPPWWMRDCIYIRLPFPNEEYMARCVSRVSKQLESTGKPVVVVYHHVPRSDLLDHMGDERDFANAYAGSRLLDKPVREYGVSLVVYGHVHDRSRERIVDVGGVVYANAYPWYHGSMGLLIVKAGHGVARARVNGF